MASGCEYIIKVSLPHFQHQIHTTTFETKKQLALISVTHY